MATPLAPTQMPRLALTLTRPRYVISYKFGHLLQTLGDSPLRWVPQAVSSSYGQPLDIDIVLNEMFKDQDHVFVEYSSGPLAYQARLDVACAHQFFSTCKKQLHTMVGAALHSSLHSCVDAFCHVLGSMLWVGGKS